MDLLLDARKDVSFLLKLLNSWSSSSSPKEEKVLSLWSGLTFRENVDRFERELEIGANPHHGIGLYVASFTSDVDESMLKAQGGIM